jgi:hypothetical protein
MKMLDFFAVSLSSSVVLPLWYFAGISKDVRAANITVDPCPAYVTAFSVVLHSACFKTCLPDSFSQAIIC